MEKPDWIIGDLYNKAWQIVKKHKLLWVLGMALGAGGSANFSQSGYDFVDIFNRFGYKKDAVDKGSDVLGATAPIFADLLTNLFSSIPFYYYIVLGVEILFLILVSLFITYVYKAWANAALLHGVKHAIDEKTCSLRTLSEKAFANIKPLIWLEVIPSLVLVLITLVALGIPLALFFYSITFLNIVAVILLIISLLGLLYAWIMLTLSQIWAVRLVVYEEQKPREALSKGYHIAKKKIGAMLLLGLVNNILVGVIVGIPLLIIFGIVFVGFFSTQNNELVFPVIFGIGILLLVIFLFALSIVGGILNAFKATVWTLAYQAIKGKYDKA